MEYSEVENLNPWFSIWTKPRHTIQQIVDDDPNRVVIFLAALAGFVNGLDQMSGDNFPFVLCITIGPLTGILSLYLVGLLIRWTGRWIGGQASSVQIRAAIAWSWVILIWGALLWIPKIAVFGIEIMTEGLPDEGSMFILVFLLLDLILSIWYLVVAVKSLAQVQGFSGWRALGNIILAFILFVVILAGIYFGALLIFSIRTLG